MKRILLAAASGLLAVAALLCSQPQGARANGVPQLVKLTYLTGVSNWGPKDAEGVLEFSFAEAYARVDVKSLPPQSGYTYEGWLTGGAGAPLKIGTITVSTAGVGALEAKLTGLSHYDYDTFVVAAKGPAAPADAVPTERSIAGKFTIVSDNGTPAAGGDVGSRPGTLPDTGEQASASLRERLGRTFMIILVAGGVAILAVRFIRREKKA